MAAGWRRAGRVTRHNRLLVLERIAPPMAACLPAQPASDGQNGDRV
jgi:hypothetical protein